MHKCVHKENAVHYEYLDGALKKVKKLGVELWTPVNLHGPHLCYVVEGGDTAFFALSTIAVGYKPSIGFLG